MARQPTDSDIVDAIRSGTRERVNWALEWLYTHREYATSFMKKKGGYLPGLGDDLAKDIFQDTILTFMDKVWAGDYEVRPGANLKTYLYRTALNKFQNEQKTAYSRMEHGMHYLQNELTEPLLPDGMLLEKERYDLFEKGMSLLGEARAKLIRMFDFEQKSHREIGEILDISENAAKQQYYRTRQEFNRILRTHGHFD